ncbi:MAG: hypothetical protein VB106_17345, partial [Clostridiaceae bacterium]|nr:hypothetical protein [Clostridiaceae bacterium]
MKKLRSIGPIALSVAIIIALGTFFSGAVIGNADPFSEFKEKLSIITEEEKEILQNLFILTQEIEAAEAEEEKLSREIETINKEIKALEAVIAEDELAFGKKRESLKQVLKSYQRMGPGSFLEIILDSDSLSTFLQRLNTVRDLTHNTGTLLEGLAANNERLERERSKLSENLVLVKDKQKLSREALTNKMELKAEKEEYLTSLKGEKEYYREYLSRLEEVWSELKLLLSRAAKEFSRMIEEDGLPTDALKLSFSLSEVRGAIDDGAINKVISGNPRLEDMVFAFHPEVVEIRIPEKDLILKGTFVILEGHTLKFLAQEGSFFGMPLEPGALEELFREGDMELNL